MQADEFIARVNRGDAGITEIDGVTVVGPRRPRADKPVIGRVYYDHPDHLAPGTFYVSNFDRNVFAWRVMEVVAPGRSTPWVDTIGNVEPAECLRRAVRIAKGLNHAR